MRAPLQLPGEFALPNLLILGQQKAGTTWLFEQLSAHPEIQGSRPKELFLFNKTERKVRRALPRYVRKFPQRPGVRYYMEASANYFWVRQRNDPWDDASWHSGQNWHTPQEVHRWCGERVKLVVLFRHPVARAISAFYHNFRKGRVDQSSSILEVGKRYGIVSMSRVRASLGSWNEYYSNDKFLFLNFDSIKRNPRQLLSRTFEHLQLAPENQEPAAASGGSGHEVPKNVGFKLRASGSQIEVDSTSLEKANRDHFGGAADHFFRFLESRVGVKTRRAPVVTREEVERLQELFLPEIEFMEEIFGEALPHWKTYSLGDLLRL